MEFKEFWKNHIALLKKYDVCCELDCDLWSHANGYLYYRSEDVDNKAADSIAHITGVSYTRDGSKLIGDFEGYLSVLEEALSDILQT